ncbi:Maf family protein [Candidatus Acidulodesulfobacterium sp. H_13]|uniref:Maf family protein n=1 Tax=Candidatus Acidulodesulfobacterium sp. H_13 TaxID=3395470 RepID=UPI003AF8CBCA
MEKKIILASSSKRRIYLLEKLGLNFVGMKHRLSAEPMFNEKTISIECFASDLALKKAASLQDDYPDSFIIGSDTVIYSNGKAFGKPKDFNDAVKTLSRLSGKIHYVYTGACLINKNTGVCKTVFDKTSVAIKPLSKEDIVKYLNKHSPMDKAGSYGIQDKGEIIESYSGSFENVLGLCVQKLIPILRESRLI